MIITTCESWISFFPHAHKVYYVFCLQQKLLDSNFFSPRGRFFLSVLGNSFYIMLEPLLLVWKDWLRETSKQCGNCANHILFISLLSKWLTVSKLLRARYSNHSAVCIQHILEISYEVWNKFPSSKSPTDILGKSMRCVIISKTS